VKIPAEYDRDTDTQNSTAIFRPVSLLGVSAATKAENFGA
jgi:hypothetical protein